MKLKPFGNIVEGPQGFRMPESLARQIEDSSKGLPKDFTFRRRAKTPTEFTLEAGARTDLSVVSTDAIDHQKEVVIPTGIDFDIFRQNPIVPFAHNYDALQVGKCLWIKSGTGGVKALTKYADCPPNHQNWLPDAIVSLMKDDMCKGKSIGFIPTHVRTPSSEEVSRRPELKQVDAVIDQAVLLEYSVAPVPCNPDALVIAVGKSVKSKELASLILNAASAVKAAPDSESSGTDDDAMPSCPKCMRSNDVSTKDDGATYTCSVCGLTFTAAESAAKQQAMEMVVPFMSPQTLDAYRKRIMQELKSRVETAAAAQFADAIDRMRGRV